MTLLEVKVLLEQAGMPVTYRAWPRDPVHHSPPPLPWICYIETSPNPFLADGKIYSCARGIRAELYTKDKDPGSEAALESVLNAAEIIYDKEETYNDSECCYEIIYEFEV